MKGSAFTLEQTNRLIEAGFVKYKFQDCYEYTTKDRNIDISVGCDDNFKCYFKLEDMNSYEAGIKRECEFLQEAIEKAFKLIEVFG